MKIKIKVTKEILHRSRFCPPLDDDNGEIVRTNCAFALAVRELFPYADVAQCTTNLLGSESERDRIMNPEPMKNYIKNFDNCTPEQRLSLPEITVDIEIPDYVLESVGIGQAYKVLSESKTLELVSI